MNARLDRLPARITALAIGLAGLLSIYAFIARPWFHRWGATDAEVAMRLPGDDIVPDAATQETRAITIAAPADQVWGWVPRLARIGPAFTAIRCSRISSAARCRTSSGSSRGFRDWKLGDKLWMYPPHKAGGAGFAVLRVLVPVRRSGSRRARSERPLTAVPTAAGPSSSSPSIRSRRGLIFRGRGAGGLKPLASVFSPASSSRCTSRWSAGR